MKSFKEQDDMHAQIRNCLTELERHYFTASRSDMLTLMSRCLILKNKIKHQSTMVVLNSGSTSNKSRKALEAPLHYVEPKKVLVRYR